MVMLGCINLDLYSLQDALRRKNVHTAVINNKSVLEVNTALHFLFMFLGKITADLTVILFSISNFLLHSIF